MYNIRNGIRKTAEYMRTSESSVIIASARPSTHNLMSYASASYGLHMHRTLGPMSSLSHDDDDDAVLFASSSSCGRPHCHSIT